MSLQRVSASMAFLDTELDPEIFVPVFHEWIRGNTVEGLLIDVATYAHVPDGPGLILIGHEGDYSIDMAAGHPSLRYVLKRDGAGTPREIVARVVRRLVGAADAAAAAPGAHVDRSELMIRVVDRLTAPNTPGTLAALAPEIEAGVRDALGADASVTLEPVEGDPREALTVVVRVGSAVAVG